MSWTEDRVEILKKLWVEGKTAAEIAKTLGGVTRNAVIGKAHRLKLSNRLSPIQQNKKPVKTPPAANTSVPVEKRAPKIISSPKPADIKDGKSLAELGSGECRWSYGDPKESDFCFCAETVIAGLPYCMEHATLAYQPATRNKILKAEDFEEKPSKDDSAEFKNAVGA